MAPVIISIRLYQPMMTPSTMPATTASTNPMSEVLAAVCEVLQKVAVQQVFPESLRNRRRAAHEQRRDLAGGPERLPDNQQ